MSDAPDGWTNDSLSALLQTAQENRLATFANHPFTSRLIEIDGLFERALKDAVNPKPQVPIFFALRAHSAWRAAVSLSMAGQVSESYPVYRTAMELLAYGAFIGDDIDLFKMWSSRSSGPAAKQRIRDKFTHAAMCRKLSSMSGPIGEDYKTLYDRTIDFGGHPNELGLYGSMVMEVAGDSRRIQLVHLHGKGLQLDGAMLSGVQIGMWMLHLCQLIWPARLMLLGIREALATLRADPLTIADATSTQQDA